MRKKVLEVLRKNISLQQVKRAVKLTKDARIKVLTYFMLGTPRETPVSIRQSINLAKTLNPDFAIFSITTPYPGTDLYNMLLEEGYCNYDYWDAYISGKTTDPVPLFGNREELQKITANLYKEFYMRPKFILKKLFQIDSFEEAKWLVKAFFSLLKS